MVTIHGRDCTDQIVSQSVSVVINNTNLFIDTEALESRSADVKYEGVRLYGEDFKKWMVCVKMIRGASDQQDNG